MPVHCLPGEEIGCTMGRRQDRGSSVMLWAMSCWVTLGPDIHVDVTLTYNLPRHCCRPSTALHSNGILSQLCQHSEVVVVVALCLAVLHVHYPSGSFRVMLSCCYPVILCVLWHSLKQGSNMRVDFSASWMIRIIDTFVCLKVIFELFWKALRNNVIVPMVMSDQ